MFLDLHATSTKKNCFIFGSEFTEDLSSNLHWIGNRIFMKIMHESMEYFQ
jgi:hypothetical protein